MSSTPYVDQWGESDPPAVRQCHALRRLVLLLPMPESTRDELERTVYDLHRLLARPE